MLKSVGCLLLFASLSWGATAFTETFTTDAAGFGPNTLASVVAWTGSGGNLDGNILVRRDLGEAFFDIGADTSRTEFTGDYGADGINFLTVDLSFFTSNFTSAWFRFRSDTLTNGWAAQLTANPSVNGWNTYALYFNPFWTDAEANAAGWFQDLDAFGIGAPSPSFASVMSSVGFAEVRLQSTDESSLAAIDNVSIGQTPEPSTWLMLVCGLGALGMRKRRA